MAPRAAAVISSPAALKLLSPPSPQTASSPAALELLSPPSPQTASSLAPTTWKISRPKARALSPRTVSHAAGREVEEKEGRAGVVEGWGQTGRIERASKRGQGKRGRARKERASKERSTLREGEQARKEARCERASKRGKKHAARKRGGGQGTKRQLPARTRPQAGAGPPPASVARGRW